MSNSLFMTTPEHTPSPVVASLPVARAAFLRLMIPQLLAGGFDALGLAYFQELSDLEDDGLVPVIRP
jgi:hypothetical protein